MQQSFSPVSSDDMAYQFARPQTQCESVQQQQKLVEMHLFKLSGKINFLSCEVEVFSQTAVAMGLRFRIFNLPLGSFTDSVLCQSQHNLGFPYTKIDLNLSARISKLPASHATQINVHEGPILKCSSTFRKVFYEKNNYKYIKHYN